MSATTLRVPLVGTNDVVEVMQPTKATQDMRAQADSFLRHQPPVWQSFSEREVGRVATAAVVDEVLGCAKAFHTNKAGTVDLVWLKKDMPLEALKDASVGYWRGRAGPAAQGEQFELEQIRDVPAAVNSTIRITNNSDLIAHFYYAYVDFWIFILIHLLIWLACIFFYGYLCILQPIIIVGESSKLYRIFTELSAPSIFKKDIPDSRLGRFSQWKFYLGQSASLMRMDGRSRVG